MSGSKRDMKTCHVCNVTLPTLFWNAHCSTHSKSKPAAAAAIGKKNPPGNEDFELFIKGLGGNLCRDALLDYFSRFGEVKNLRVIEEKNIAFLGFKSSEEQEAATRVKLPFINGRKILVQKKIENKKKVDVLPSDGGSIDHRIVEDALASSDIIADQIFSFVDSIKLGDEDYRQRIELCRDLEYHLSATIPGCRLAVFGSTLTGLGLKYSDLDLYLHVPENFFYNESTDSVVPNHKMVIKKVVNSLRRHRGFMEIQGIPQARVPIVKFTHRPTGIHCDIQSSTSFGVGNSALLRTLHRMDMRATSLIYLIRYWAKRLELTGGNDRVNFLSNYALCLLIVFFLIRKGVLPSIGELQRQVRPHERTYIDSWDVSFNSRPIFATQNPCPTEYLLRDFFQFYGNEFDTDTYVVSVKDGVPVERESFVALNLPESQLDYAAWVANGGSKLNVDSPLVVQDPFELAFSVTGVFSFDALANFKNRCRSAAKILSSGKPMYYLSNLFNIMNYEVISKKRKAKSPKASAKRRKFSDDLIARGAKEGTSADAVDVPDSDDDCVVEVVNSEPAVVVVE